MFFYLKNCPYSGGKSWTDRLWSLSIKADSYANEFLPLCQILFFFFFKWRCFNKNCFLSWKCFRKKESRSLYRDAIRKGLFTTPGKIILGKKKKKKVLQPAKLICQLLHKKAGISLMENVFFFSWMKPSVDVMGELWGSIHEGQLNSDIFQQCLIWIMLDLLQLKLII